MIGRFAGLFLLCLIMIVPAALAQSPTSTPEETILRDINVLRKSQGVIYLARNPILDTVAKTFVDYLASVPPATLNTINRYQANGQTIDQLLQTNGYGAYSDGYTVDFIPWPSFTVTSENLIQYFRDDASSNTRSVQSRKMSLQQTGILPFSERIYREIGIGYTFNEESKLYIYVIIFASQPGVLPVTVTTQDDSETIVSSVTAPEITLRIQNEYSHSTGDRIGDQRFIGNAKTMRISEQPPADDSCPQSNEVSDEETINPPHWERYKNRRDINLSSGFGLKTVYVELCDNVGIKTVSQVSVLYSSEADVTPGAVASETVAPDVMGIVQATQTAAASATSYAPVLETVEAILTATASAP